MYANTVPPNTSAIIMVVLCCLAASATLYLTAQPLYFIALLCAPLMMVLGLQLPFLLAVGFVIFSFFRIHEAFPFLMPLHIPFLLSAGAIASFGWCLMRQKITLFWTPELTCFLLFFLHCTVGIILAENRPMALAYFTSTYLKIAIMLLIITYLTRTPRQLRWISRLVVLAGTAIAIVAIKNKLAGIGLVEGTRVTISRELGSVLGDPNDLALTLLFPLSFAMTMSMRWGVRRTDRIIAMIGSVVIFVGIMYTQSRGGLLGVATIGGILTWYRVRSKTLLITLGVIALSILFAVAGISDRSSGGAAEVGIDESASIRLHAWEAAFNMALHHPVSGVGLDNYVANFYFYSDFWDNKTHAVHSTWFGVLAETGFVGFILFSLMVWQLLKTARRLHCETQNPARTQQAMTLSITAESLLAGICAFIVSGTFLTQGFTWPLYILMSLTIAAYRLHKDSKAIRSSQSSYHFHRQIRENSYA